ncbi:hypothetical protein RND81_05G080000 [Saponaria officinalis]|uniref:DUF3741 domain-containing protein n=1 Tax=Saponaria officinalis TaxID=3572 RepID=A0AAW1KR92_SAPOF
MGREWYFGWGSKSATKKGGIKSGDDGGSGGRGGGGGGDKKTVRPQVAVAAAAAGGCMNAMIHLFDFHHLHLCLHSQNSSYLPDDPSPSKGVEAPRNSLEEFQNTKEKHNYPLKVPMEIQNKTNRRDTRLKLVQAPRCKVEDILSENAGSPAIGTRTPTLVARLMGLDILPESNNNTPRSSSSSYSHISTHTPHVTSTKTRKKSSLNNDFPCPQSSTESPRSSSSSSSQKRSRNVVDKHRLSLQIDKENNIVKEMESSRPSCSAINTKRREGRKYEEENKSPGYYARQIMKQVKETVSRRVGADITNTVGPRDLRRDENLLSTKTPTKSKKSRLVKSSEISQKVSEKLRALDVSVCDVQEDVPIMDKLQVKLKNEQHYCTNNVDMGLKNFGVIGTKSCSKTPSKSYEPIKNKKDEQFVRPQTRANNSVKEKNCKKTTLSSDLVHVSVPSIVPLKKDIISPQAHPKLLQQQGLPKAQKTKLINNISTTNTPTWSSRSPSQRTYEKTQETTHKPAEHEKKKGSTTTSSSIEEFQYISRILKCTGIDKDTPIYFTKWYSPSHPLNPQIYQSLEISHYRTPPNIDHYSPSDIHRSLSINRKLIFHLVDEILADILKPNHYHQYHHINGLQLVRTLCTKIQSSPRSNCQTLQDIDALIEKDMSRIGTVSNLGVFEEECNTIVTEIEHDIVQSLVQEIGCVLLGL